MSDIYAFTKEQLVNKEREFYLFTTPPKRELKAMDSTLAKANLLPNCMLYFGWSDSAEIRPDDGPFLDLQKLKSFIKVF